MKKNFKLIAIRMAIAGLLLIINSCDFSFGGQPSNHIEPDYDIDDDIYNPGTGWTLSWADEFNDGLFDSNIWDRQVWLNPPNGEWEKYTGHSSTAYELDGSMVLKATYNGPVHGSGNYTSARVISNPGGGTGNSGSTGKTFRYGKIAARIKLPSGKGIWPAFWLLGDNINETGGNTSWPQCGEIDILETGSASENDGYFGHATAGQAIHFANADNNHQYLHGSKRKSGGPYSDDFHVFEIEWDAQKIVWKIDGLTAHSEYITASHLSEFHQDFYVIFNIAVGGNYTHAPDSSTQFPQYMHIDWIRHYEKN